MTIAWTDCRGGLRAAKVDAPYGGFAQIPLIRCRLLERVVSDPSLSFPVGPGTAGERERFRVVVED